MTVDEIKKMVDEREDWKVLSSFHFERVYVGDNFWWDLENDPSGRIAYREACCLIYACKDGSPFEIKQFHEEYKRAFEDAKKKIRGRYDAR